MLTGPEYLAAAIHPSLPGLPPVRLMMFSSPSQTGWSARNQGVGLAGVFYLAAHAGSCYREVSGWYGDKKTV